MIYDTQITLNIYSSNGGYKPSHITGGPHIVCWYLKVL